MVTSFKRTCASMLFLPELLYSVTLTLRHATVDHTSVETPGHCSTEWSKSEKGKQILCVDAYIWNLGTSLVAQTVKNLPTVKNPLAVQETQFQSLGRQDPLKKGMAINFSIPAWRIPWTEETCQLQSMWSQKARHDCLSHTHTHTHNLEKWYWWAYLQSNNETQEYRRDLWTQ